MSLFAVLICAASTEVARAVSYSIQGQNNGSSTWGGPNLNGWAELDCIPIRIDITGGPVTNVVFNIAFPRDNGGAIPGFQDLYNWVGTSNVIFVTSPVLTTNTGATWNYSMTVTVTNNAEADINFCARLAAGAHNYPGSSLHIDGFLGGSGTSIGGVHISKPNSGSGTPDLSIVKTGPALINAGSFVTYTLIYSNTTASTAGGVQLTDFLPTNATFVSCSGGCSGNTNNSTIVWDLGLLNKGASGFVSYTMYVSSNQVNGTVVNTASILTVDNDPVSGNNTSTVTSTLTNGCVAATIGAQPVSAVVCAGTSASFSVGVNGTTPYSYQWRKNGANIVGATSSFYSIGSASAGDAASYSVVVTNGCGSVTSSAATLTVNASTAATALANQTACPSNNVTFATTASGAGPFTYQWQKNGSNLTTQTNSSLLLTNVSASDSATYSVAVAGTCNSVTNSATLTVNTVASSAGLTSITNNCSGTTAAFVEVVTGSGPFTYVWKKNGTIIGGQTSSSLVIPATSLSDAGSYSVEVTGSCNSLTNTATLSVSTGTAGTPLTSVIACPGQSASFNTTASGAGPFSYQWRKNGADIGGQTSSALSVASVSLGDAGTYSVEISGGCNKITNSATLTVNTPLSGGVFGNQTVCAGQSATFTTVPAGSGPFTYVWKKDGIVQGSISNSITVVSAALSDAGTYSVEVNGPCNSVTNSAVLTVNTPTTASALTSLVLCPGQSATFTTVASGTGPLTYVWRKDGVVQSSTTSSLTVASVSAGDAGTYTVEVAGACNSVTNTATLNLNTVTTATALTNATNCVGSSVTFSTTASGTGPFAYVWKKDGVVQSSTTNSLTVASVSGTDAGTYTVELTGACTSVTNSATLTVNTLATATALTPVVVCEGQSASFSTTASGTGPFTYVWKKDGVVLGSTSSSLAIASATVGDAGNYTVEVTGSCNSVTNGGALTVNSATTASSLVSLTVCPGQSAAFTTVASGTGPFTYVWKKDGVVQASTTSALSIASAASGDAGTYTVEVTGVCTSVTNSATLTVNQVTAATSLTDLTLCPGSPATFSTVASGTGPITYVWKKDGIVQSSTGNTLSIASVASGDAGTYTVEVTGACTSVTNSAVLTVNTPTTATALTDIITCGQSATFTTVVSGTGPFTFVWKKDGVVQSSTTNSLTVPSVASGDAGTYTVEVTGVCTSVTNSATLTLNADTTATASGDQTVCQGQSVMLSTAVSGSGPFTYVWKKDGVVQSSTNNLLTIASATSGDAGTYTVEINGACNSVTNSAVLTVNTPTTSSALASLVVCPGQSATFTTVPAGTGPFAYVWKKDGAVQASTTNVLTVASAAASDAGTYTVEVTGACNSVTNDAMLTVNENTSATSLTDLVLCPGQAASFATTVSGTGPFGYVWKKDGVVLSGETTNTLSVASVTAANAGVYTVEVTGVCNNVTNAATLTVNENVSATALTDVVVCENQPASFTTTASGTGPFIYVWKKDGTVLSGQTNSSISITSTQLSDGGAYVVEVTGVCTSVTNSASLTVNQTTAATDLTSLVLCPGQNATFTTVPSGTGPFSYVWSKDGQVIGSETTDHITISGVAAANAGTYSVHVTGTCNSVDKSATLTVNENTTATSLTDLVLCPGQTASFATTASGTGPFGYVWKKDGVVLSGETTNTLSVASVVATNAGVYTVEVTGVCTSVTNSATLTVNENVSATALTDLVVCEGQPASFATTASGTGPLTYVWKKDGSVLSGQTDSTISIASAQLSDAGVYTVEVTGVCTSVTNSATLTVNATTTATDLTSLTLCPGQNVTFTTVASGTGPFSYVWSKDGQVIGGETTDHLTINGVVAANAGTYSVHVTGTCNSVDKSATLTVNENTSATSLTDLVLCPGQTASFTTTVSGTGPFGYVWKKDGVVLSGETTNTLIVASVVATNAGVYTVEVTGVCTSVTNAATLTVNENVSATALTDVVVCENQAATFSTTASGTGPLTYVWKKDGSVLSGQTNSSISIASAQLSDAGIYVVEVTGVCTSATNSASLTVNSLTTSSDLTSLLLCPGQNATFTTVASGAGPFSYVWSKDGQVIGGETTDHITISGVTAANSGTYSVHVTGTCNSVDKSATLTVNENTTATSLTDLVLCPGQTASFATTVSGTGPFGYVWKKDGVVLSGETTNTLIVASVVATNAGVYTVEVTGVCTSVTNSATLTLNENVSATALTDVVVCENQLAAFSTTASGTGPFSYVWKKDGSVLSGQTNSSISIASAQLSDAGVYVVEVTGVCTSVTNSANLTVNQTTTAGDLTSLILCPGQNATFTTVPSGTGPFSYVWTKDGQVIGGETTDHLTINGVAAANAGTYSVHVTGTCNSVDKSATLTVNENTTATSLTDLVLCPGQTTTFATTASGTGPFGYVWKKDSVVLSGETTNTLSIASVAATNAGVYTVEVTGVCTSVTNSATLTVNENVSATALTDVVVCENQPASFSTTASGTGPLAYVWKKDGTVLSGQTNSSISIASAQLSDAGVYTVEVTGVCTSMTNSASLTVNSLTTSSDLASLVLCPGQGATFSTVPSGTGPFSYVWSKDGQVLAGETTDHITIDSVAAANGGTYSVHVTGTCNSVDKSATLTVNENTAATGPSDVVLCPGQNATLTTIVTGTGPFGFVWKKDGVVLGGQTTNTLSVGPVTAADAGSYTVEVTGVCTSVTNTAVVTVNENVSSSALADLVVCQGQSATFTTVPAGTGPYTFVWKKDGAVLSTQTNNSVTIASADLPNAGTYTVEVSGLCTSVTNSATLTVNSTTTASDLSSLVVCPGQGATFSTVPSGTGPFSYVWTKDGQVMPGETTDHITISSATAADAGTYNVHVSGTCNSVDKIATLTVNENTSATSLSDVVLCPGQTTTFATTVSGTGPFGFVWKKDGVVLGGQITNSLNIGPVTAVDAGTYTVEVTGVCTSVTNSAVVTVNENVSASALTDVVVCQGQPAAFSTTAAGTGPYTFVWKKDGVVLSGETNNSISIASADLPNAGLYTVEVSGVCTSVTNSATLTVNSTTTASDLSSLTLCPGQNATFTTVPSGTGPFSYVWSKDGQVIGGETTDHIIISGVTAANAGTYSVHVTGTCNSVDKSATLTVNENTTASSLAPLTLCPGQTATFTTAVSGTGPFGFVWKKDGVLLPGETTNALIVSSVVATNAGTYTVEVTGICTSVTNSAVLSVLDNVSSTALTDLVVCQGQTTGFSTTSAGTGPFTYVWKKDGIVLIGETNNSISIASADLPNAGTYTVEVGGVCTSVTNSATLTVNSTTAASDLSSLTLCPGQDATFTTVASGTGPFSFVWSKNGQVIGGETTDHITITGVSAANAGTYNVHVTGTCNSVDKTATLAVNENTAATSLADLVLCPGQTATFATTVSGTGPFGFVWKKDGVVLNGETTNTLNIASVAATNAGTYTVEITGVCNNVTNSATLTVNTIVGATALTDVVVCENQPATFSTIASGTGPFTYVWKKDGTVLSTQTNNSISFASAQVGDAGVYTVEVTGICTSATNSASLTVNRLTTTSDLANLVLCPGQNATFTTVASGTGPFSYVWSKDGQVMGGETADHITINNITSANAGTYSVHVSGTCNSADKSATLTVNENTSASALTSLVVCPGQPADFMTIPSGTGPFSYVWKKDGIVQGSTSNSLVILSVNSGDAGTYTVEVSGACMSVTNSAILSLNTNVSATALIDVVRCPGSSATFSTVASGTGPLTYTWRKDGNAINGQTNSSLTLASVALSDAGVYSVEVTGVCNTATNSATLVVNTNVSATPLVNINACPGTTNVFSTIASGTGPFTYQWNKDGQTLAGETNSSLTVANVSLSDSGVYSVVVSGACSSVTNGATLSVGTLAATPLSNINTCQGQPATFATVASGTAPFSYVWKKNGSTIVTATGSSYTIANPQTTDVGTYTVTVNNACLSVTNSAILSVGQAITASALVPITRCPGQSATFSTTVGGSGPYVFVWKQNGQVILGQTNSSIVINPLSNANSGTYSVEVTGFCNSVTNSSTLTVKTNVTTAPIGDYVVCVGQGVTFTTTSAGTPPFAYRWRRNGSVISGATASTYTIASASTNNAGTYSVEVTGSCNVATNFGSLTVAPATSITALVDQFVCSGGSNLIVFHTTATGGAPFTYTWATNGTVIAGQTGNVLTLTNVPPSTNIVSVTVAGGCGTATSTAKLTVDGTTIVTGAITFTSGEDITINDNQPASPYPSTINVHCIPGLPKKVRVTLLNVTHSYPHDIEAMVVSPSGQALPLMVQCGGNVPISYATLTFDDDASSSLPANGPITTGSYKPTSYAVNPQFPYPAPPANAVALASFANQDPSGTWSLYVRDNNILDDGFMKGGWALTLIYGDESPSKFIDSVYLPDDTFRTTLVGPAGLIHIVQSSPDLVNWTSIATNTLPTGSFTITIPVTPTGPKQFYRAIRPF